MKPKPEYMLAYTYRKDGTVWFNHTGTYGRIRYIINHSMRVDPEHNRIIDYQFFDADGYKCSYGSAVVEDVERENQG